MSRNIRVGLEDQLLATLEEHGPLTTGRLRQLTRPHYQNAQVAHGRLTPTDPNTQGLPAKHRWETCPDCQCTETRELEGGWATPRVRLALRRLERSGQVARIKSPAPNNYGGDLWIRFDPGPTQERTRGIEL
jgi:hypothetical protein